MSNEILVFKYISSSAGSLKVIRANARKLKHNNETLFKLKILPKILKIRKDY